MKVDLSRSHENAFMLPNAKSPKTDAVRSHENAFMPGSAPAGQIRTHENAFDATMQTAKTGKQRAKR